MESISEYQDYLAHLKSINSKDYPKELKRYQQWYENKLAQGQCPECGEVKLQTYRQGDDLHFEYVTECQACGALYIV